MATLYNKLSSTITNINLPNASMGYNFNGVTMSGKDTTDQRYTSIEASFPGYTKYIKTPPAGLVGNNQLLISLKTLSLSTNITYYDNVINSTQLYKINFIHVGLSPINLNKTYCWCIMLDLKTTSLDTLIIIIPITYVVPITASGSNQLVLNEQPEFSKLLYNCNYSTNNQIDITKFILPTIFTTFYNTNPNTSITNRVIILNSSINTSFYDVVKLSLTTLNPMYINSKFLSSTIYNPPTLIKTISQNPIYLCSKLPIKQADVLQNDIYIDCYKVGDTDKVLQDIKNPLRSVSKNKRGNQQKQLALFGLLLSCIIIYLFFKFAKYVLKRKGPGSGIEQTSTFSFFGRSSPALARE
jgi:hypothetical protein